MKQSLDLMDNNEQHGMSLTRMFYIITGFSGLLIAVVVIMAVSLWSLKNQQNKIPNDIPVRAVQDSQSASSEAELEYTALKNLLDHAIYKPLWVKQLNPVSMSRVLTVLAASNIEALWLDGIQVDFSKQSFILSGKTQQPKALMSWLRYLRQAKIFGTASLVNMQLDLTGTEYRFKVEGRL